MFYAVLNVRKLVIVGKEVKYAVVANEHANEYANE